MEQINHRVTQTQGWKLQREIVLDLIACIVKGCVCVSTWEINNVSVALGRAGKCQLVLFLA